MLFLKTLNNLTLNLFLELTLPRLQIRFRQPRIEQQRFHRCASSCSICVMPFAFHVPAYGDILRISAAFRSNEKQIPHPSHNHRAGANSFAVSEGDYMSWFSCWVFAVASSTIPSGSMSERTSLEGYIILSAFVHSWIYPVFYHWVFHGWLSRSFSGIPPPPAEMTLVYFQNV